MSYLQTALEAGGLCVCSVELKTISHLLCLDAHCALIPACAVGQGLDVPSSPCFSMPVSVQRKPGEGEREGAAAFTSQAANWAGRAEHPLCGYTALHCSPCLRAALINTSGTNKNTEMRGKIQPLLLANSCVSCWQVF